MFCDGQHSHQSWKPRIQDGKFVFPTAEEAAYPWLLCTRIVNLALDAAKCLGAVLYSTLEVQMDNKEFALMSRCIFEGRKFLLADNTFSLIYQTGLGSSPVCISI